MVKRRKALQGCRRLDAESLAADFGAKSKLGREGVITLFNALEASCSPEVEAAGNQWTASLQATFGRDSHRLASGLNALADAYAVAPGHDPLALLFAVQTHYVLIVKLLAAQVMSESGRCESLRDSCLVPGGGIAGDPFAWYLHAWSDPIEVWLQRVAGVWQDYDSSASFNAAAGTDDLLKTLYQQTFPRRLRHCLGEYYTPGWLVEQMLDDVAYPADASERLLDPACGSGAFLVSAIRRLRARWTEEHGSKNVNNDALCRAILSGVVGIDLNPLAVITARTNYLIAIADLLPHIGPVDVPVYLGDSIVGEHPQLCDFEKRFDYVVGNPPWIAWDDLPNDDRQATKPLWEHYGLFTLSGSEARHGGGKKDLSMLMIYAAADRYLKSRGRLAMVVTQTLFQTRGAGDGFRRFRLGRAGEWLRIVRVNDFVQSRPFADTANWTATLVLEKGCATSYPVPYVKYSADRTPLRFDAVPIDPARPTSPWMLWPHGSPRPATEWIGPSDYKAHLGANTGGANGVYWLELTEATAPGVVRVRNIGEKGKRAVRIEERLVESALVYPLLRWRDVDRFRAGASAHLLLAQDPQTRRGIEEPLMREEYPHAFEYLTQFREVLERRAAYRRYQARAAFYSMYDVGPYTVAPIKVVWRRMDRRINAAVVEPIEDPRLGLRPVIPQETCVLVAVDSADEAHYLCAMLNSSLVDFLVTSHSVQGGKSFGSPGMLDFLPIRRYDAANEVHRALAEASQQAHQVAGAGDDLTPIQVKIDRSAELLWDASPSVIAPP